MPLESASFISQLDSANPLGNEPKSVADDHIRLTKSVLKTQFPNFGAVAINTTALALNQLTAAVTADSSGNVCIGTTAAGWGAAFKALQIGAAAAFYGTASAAVVASNSYNDGAVSRYLNNGAHGYYLQAGNIHTWGGAASGAAGTLITSAEYMRIDAGGNLIPTLSSSVPALSANLQLVMNLTSDTNLRISVRGSDGVTRTANLTLA
jgi:hypothetical protein